ncbi:hypothetical protein ABZP36_012770 [Zizania latifolia]
MSSTCLARILRSLCIAGDLCKAVHLLCRSPLCPGAGTYALLLQECVNRRDARLGKRIQARMVSTGFDGGVYIATKLLIFYVKIGELGVARNLFDGMSQRCVAAWNAMISGCTRGGVEAQAVEMFGSMRTEGMRPDQFTFASVLCACARLAALEHGRRVHGVMVKSDVVAGNVFTNSALVDMYLKCSCPEDARRAFAAAPAIRSLGIKKDPAWSAVEVQGKRHTFLAGDSYHDECSAIYEICNALASAVTEQSVPRAVDSATSHCSQSELGNVKF